MTKDEQERLEREMAALGWTSETTAQHWVLTDPTGEKLKTAYPPFVRGFAYGYLRGREDAAREGDRSN